MPLQHLNCQILLLFLPSLFWFFIHILDSALLSQTNENNMQLKISFLTLLLIALTCIHDLDGLRSLMGLTCIHDLDELRSLTYLTCILDLDVKVTYLSCLYS